MLSDETFDKLSEHHRENVQTCSCLTSCLTRYPNTTVTTARTRPICKATSRPNPVRGHSEGPSQGLEGPKLFKVANLLLRVDALLKNGRRAVDGSKLTQPYNHKIIRCDSIAGAHISQSQILHLRDVARKTRPSASEVAYSFTTLEN